MSFNKTQKHWTIKKLYYIKTAYYVHIKQKFGFKLGPIPKKFHYVYI